MGDDRDVPLTSPRHGAREVRRALADARRLAALGAAGLLDAVPEVRFDDLTRLTARALGVPVSLVSLVDDHRQYFKSKFGVLPQPWDTLRESDLDHSFCKHVVADERPLVINDAHAVPALAGNLAISDLGVTAYLGVPIRAPGGEVLGSLCAIDSAPRVWSAREIAFLSDLARIVAREIELRVSVHLIEQDRKRLSTLLAYAREGIIGFGSGGIVTFCNPAAQALLGRPDGELVGASAHALVHERRPDGTPCDPSSCEDLRLIRAGDVVGRDTFLFRKGSGTFPARYSSGVLRESGKVAGAVILFVDRTATVQRETELRTVAQRLTEESLVLERFLSFVSHELRRPLVSIASFADMLRRGSLTLERARDLASILEEDARRTGRLLDDLLDFGRLRSGATSRPLGPVDLAPILRQVIAVLQPSAPRHKLGLTVPPRVPILADADRLTQVFTNLVDNAVKYSPEGGSVEIGVMQDPSSAEISVRDHGPGIPPEDLERIFEPYARGLAGTSPIVGTGLGLPIVRVIVEQHGGRVWAENAPSGGAVLKVRLPLAGGA